LALACSGATDSTDRLAGEEGAESPADPSSPDSGVTGERDGVGGSGPVSADDSDDDAAGGMGGAGGESPDANNGGAAGVSPATTSAGQPLPLVLDGEPRHFRYVRLTHEQWENSLRDNLRLPGPTGFRDALTPDVRGLYRYSTHEGPLFVESPLSLEYAEAAEKLADQVTSDPAQLLAVYDGNDADGFTIAAPAAP
jgi:hypothetical protein